MPGAIIPDDWDGSTYECLKIQWPASPLWRALLFGQVSEPGATAYWDPSTGDQEVAAVAAARAYGHTISQDELGCEEPTGGNGMVDTYFKAYRDGNVSLVADEWTDIVFNTLEDEAGDHGFDIVTGKHDPHSEGKSGLWLYQVRIAMGGTRSAGLRCRNTQGTNVFSFDYFSENSYRAYDFTTIPASATVYRINFRIRTTDETLLGGKIASYWTGIYLGDI